jgi:hypothetical protein
MVKCKHNQGDIDMAKIHLKGTKGLNGNTPKAVCAVKSVGNGMSRSNGRRTYVYMASEIVPFKEFKNVPAADRCAHCVDRGLQVRNRQRKEKGLPPVVNLFD